MNILSINQPKRWLALTLLAAVLASPITGLKAQATTDTNALLAQEVSEIQVELTEIANSLVNSSTLTAAERAQIASSISELSKDLLYLSTAIKQTQTLQVKEVSPTELQAKFRDHSGNVVTLDYVFAPDAAPTTDQERIDAVAQRTSMTLSIPEAALRLQAQVVETFSSDNTFQPSTVQPSTVDIVEPVLAPTVPVTNEFEPLPPTVTPTGRTNVESITVTGDTEEFVSYVVVKWGAEPGFAAGTTEYDYDHFTTEHGSSDVTERAGQLDLDTARQLAADTDLPIDTIREMSVISFEHFDSASEVGRRYNAPSMFGLGVAAYFGTYSIVEKIDVTAGQDIFEMRLRSDQNEEYKLSVTPHSYRCGDDTCQSGSRFDYRAEYSVYGRTVDSMENEDVSRAELRDELETVMMGISGHFDGYNSDAVAVGELVEFMVDNPKYYATFSIPSDRASVCYGNRIKSIMADYAEFYLGEELQYKDTIPNITEVGAPYQRVDRETMRGCSGGPTNFFPSI